MRIVVLVLMIVLLPMRLWAADTMALQAGVPGQSMPADCHMAATPVDEAPTESPAGPAGCVVCHLCSASAASPEFTRDAGTAGSEAPRSPAAHFATIDRAPEHRPPIS